MIAKSIGQAFNVAYQEFLRQNGLSEDVIEDAEYNGVLEAQKILGEDLSLLSDENSAKEVSWMNDVWEIVYAVCFRFVSLSKPALR